MMQQAPAQQIGETETQAAQTATEAATQAAQAQIKELGPIEAKVEAWLESHLPFYADHRWLQVLTLVALSVLAASIVSVILKRFVSKLFSRTETTADDEVLAALTPPIYTTVIALGFRLALLRLDLTDVTTARFAHLLGTLVVVVWLVAAIRVLHVLFQAISRNPDRVKLIGPTTVPLFDNLSRIVLVLVAAYLVITIWGGDISGLLAAGGIAGLAIGFAARDTLANLFAGIFIFADSPYKVGDFINLDSGERGMVTNIGLRSTRLLTRDDVEITIPNAVMGAAKIVNESGGPHVKYRIRVPVGVAYGSDIDQVERVLMGIAADDAGVCREPEPRVRFRQFGGSSLDFELLVWVEEPVLRGKALHELNRQVYLRFHQEGIEIPYSKHDLYIKEMPATIAPSKDEGADS